MNTPSSSSLRDKAVQVITPSAQLEGSLIEPENPQGIVVFVHGSGSSRRSPRNQYVAQAISEGGLGVLLFDLLTPEEEQIDTYTRQFRFDIYLLAERTIGAADWLGSQSFGRGVKLGFFGSSTGAAAALIAAANRPEVTFAVVSRGGRPDLAAEALPRVTTPSLFIVGGEDTPVIRLNEEAVRQMPAESEKKLVIIPGATHLFEEPGALEKVALLARQWFQEHLEAAKP